MTVKQEFEKKQGSGALQKPASVGFVLDSADHAMTELKKLRKRIEALEAARTKAKPVVRVKAGRAR